MSRPSRNLLIGAVLIIALAIVGYLIERPRIHDQAYYDSMLAGTTDCSTLANFLQANLNAFHIELDRADSDPQRRQMYLDRAKDVEFRQQELSCP